MHLILAMNTRALVQVFFCMSPMALAGCFDEPTCPYGTVMVHNGTYNDDGVCVARYSSYGKPSGSSTAAPSASSTSTPPATPATPTTGGEANTGGDPTTTGGTTTPPVTPGTCGGAAATSESVRVVDKSDPVPALGDAPLLLADGSYSLVQATFYRTGQNASAVHALRAGLDVKGQTLTINAQDTSVAGLAPESLTFLLANINASAMTKTCESVHGSVSAWFFPFNVGSNTQPQLTYDSASGFVRLVVGRADGATELVFSR